MIPAEKMFVDRTDDISELEKDQKNKWLWRWLEDPDSHGDYFSTYVRKLREPAKLPNFAHDFNDFVSPGHNYHHVMNTKLSS